MNLLRVLPRGKSRGWVRGPALASVLLASACSPAPQPSIAWTDGAFVATGDIGPEPMGGWEQVFHVTAGDDPAAPPMIGDYEKRGSKLIFTPRFPPAPGVRVTARFKPLSGQPEITASFGEPAKAVVPEAMVAAIHPSAEQWPANTLRMYVEFTLPMASGDAWTHLRVLDEQGKVIEGPFVEVEPELWDPEGRRLTVLFDPGRVKRGLVDNETSGPPLVEGRTVTIEVDPSWRDARGAPLKQGYRQTVKVGPEVRLPVTMKDWTLETPQDSNADLVIRFPRPLDHALAQRAITVVSRGEQIQGQVALEMSDTVWRFTPLQPWAPESYTVIVDGIIEDVAGNRLGKVFDVDTGDPTQSTSALPFQSKSFAVPHR